jgi:hypothetical protein
LLISDVNEHVFEQSRFRAFIYGDQQAALQHILQQSDRFQANGFTTGVRTGYDQDPFSLGQLDIEGNYLLALFL